ncbi:uncharacterized protein LOC121739739 isoform X1 [Aricia agestis]|uniref:uncharacterized protein LOC121739739 isoform X1 n=2 Tax=Aricia agestis TaxID=91739 RepID=UPI001C206424|nr:uncharacterized protein LOC121739739 isoform X1 [Aricia agestis]
MRTLRQIAFDNEERYPSAAKALTNSCYMDDLICGTDNITEAKNLQKELIEVLRSAGMNLRKWSSNTSELTKDLSYDQLDTFEFKDVENRKTLGLRWNPASDTFSFQCKLTEGLETNITKRELLSEISKIYDPLGWLSPLTIRGKILFQQTWLSSLSWDDKLPDSIQDEWNELKRDLMKIDRFQIPRYLGHIGQSLHLHGFCDASEKAYACAIYLVTLNDKGAYTSKLITAKTKVVPTKKQLSLPKLELLGALLLSQLMKKVLEILYTSKEIHLHAWTDSMIVLGWLHGDISKWKQFVATRIRHITNVIPAKYWRHVKSEENAADCATRGLSSISLYNHSLWWEGPKFIQENQQRADLETYQEPTIEKKKNHSVQAALQSSSDSIIYKLLNEMSSITRVAKIIAWVSRFIYRARKNVCQANNLTASNIEDAFKLIIKTVQKFEFFEEISSLKKHRVLKSNSRLLNLNPYLDKDDILIVGGRLENTILRYSAKHPILLPTSSRLTELIIDQAHRTTLHGGPKLTLAYIRDTYWIVSGVRAVKSQLRNCIKCRRFSQTTKHQIMADLPPSRVTPARPFLNVGVDFTGHVEIKLNKGKGVRTSKGYIAVFVCMATKAVHIELVSDLSTEAFLAALRRLCSRRGTPKNIYSDNGTNFVGASKFLKREYKDIVSSINHEVIDNISEMGITWHFNAPSWPSAGGLWEAAVKSLKQHLKRVMGDQKLTYEELITLLQQIEACLNSRPLCALTEDPDDVCITPGHFLVGGPLLSRPQTDPDITHVKQRWQLVQSMNKQIWRGWSREYLQNLQTRTRWTSPTKDIELNDIVVIKEDHMPPGKWALARVCELHPGKDGHTRVVTLKTQNNVLQRPVSKLIVLPVDQVTLKRSVAIYQLWTMSRARHMSG